MGSAANSLIISMYLPVATGASRFSQHRRCARGVRAACLWVDSVQVCQFTIDTGRQTLNRSNYLHPATQATSLPLTALKNLRALGCLLFKTQPFSVRPLRPLRLKLPLSKSVPSESSVVNFLLFFAVKRSPQASVFSVFAHENADKKAKSSPSYSR